MTTSPHERLAIAVVAVLIAVTAVVVALVSNQEPPAAPRNTEEKLDEYRKFALSRSDSAATRRQPHAEAATAHLRPFNPNTADSAALVSLGLRPRQAMAIIHYRAAGGQFRRKEDLQRIYTLGSEDYRRLEPYIRIPQTADISKNEPAPRPAYPTKLKEGERVDLNTADTAMLMRVPGVGAATARRIIAYGKKLGGYVSPSQAAEVYGIADGVEKWFEVGNASPRKLNVNTASYAELISHPYLNKPQTALIMRMRRNWGSIRNIAALRADTLFTAKDIARLEPYIEF